MWDGHSCPSSLRIIYTADLHNRLVPSIAQRLRHLKEQHDALFIDGGDAIGAPNVLVRPGPEPAIRLLNEAGCDAMALGNREYFFRKRGLLNKTRGADFPLVCSNLIPKRASPEGASRGGAAPASAPVRPALGRIRRWVLLRSAGWRVGLFALCPTMIVPHTLADRFSDMRFVSPEEAASEALAALQAQAADVVIALAHITAEAQEALAAAHPEIDLVLGSHTHGPALQLQWAHGVPIVRVPPYAKAAALLEIQPGRANTPGLTEVVLQ